MLDALFWRIALLAFFAVKKDLSCSVMRFFELHVSNVSEIGHSLSSDVPSLLREPSHYPFVSRKVPDEQS